MRITGPQIGLAATCEPVLRDLPQWFGIESAIVQYVRDIESLPTFLALDDGDHAMGFMTVRRHFALAAELHVLAVRTCHHRCGVGRALLAQVEHWLRLEGTRFLQVKTLAPTATSEHYERTRRFYEAMGFTPLEIFPTLWDPRNPALLMIKTI